MFISDSQLDSTVHVTGDDEDFMSVTLNDGCVLVRVSLGSGLFETEVKPRHGNIRFDDGQWHHVNITREAREVRHDIMVSCH